MIVKYLSSLKQHSQGMDPGASNPVGEINVHRHQRLSTRQPCNCKTHEGMDIPNSINECSGCPKLQDLQASLCQVIETVRRWRHQKVS